MLQECGKKPQKTTAFSDVLFYPAGKTLFFLDMKGYFSDIGLNQRARSIYHMSLSFSISRIYNIINHIFMSFYQILKFWMGSCENIRVLYILMQLLLDFHEVYFIHSGMSFYLTIFRLTWKQHKSPTAFASILTLSAFAKRGHI